MTNSCARPLGLLAAALSLVVNACSSLPTDHLDSVENVTDADDEDAADAQVAEPPPPCGFCGPVDSSVPPPAEPPESVACKAGFYAGTFTGMYDTPLSPGSPLPVAGDVQVALEQQGTADQMCTIDVAGQGITAEACSDVFPLAQGTITGVLNRAAAGGEAGTGGEVAADGEAAGDGEAAAGGDAGLDVYPYFCVLTGVLDCARSELENGWIQCTYCDGRLADGGGACDVIGGRFAGPVAANYMNATFSLVAGGWNGAEALAGNDGGSPGPEGGPIADYLVLDGGYGVGGRYGGSGGWSATCQDCARTELP